MRYKEDEGKQILREILNFLTPLSPQRHEVDMTSRRDRFQDEDLGDVLGKTAWRRLWLCVFGLVIDIFPPSFLSTLLTLLGH